jgi:hypothetical protein
LGWVERPLKTEGSNADIELAMTAISTTFQTWATHPVGRAARIVIAVGGMATATLVLMTASLVTSGSWALVILGVGLAAFSVRAARAPTAGRLILVAAVLMAVPLTIQVF